MIQEIHDAAEYLKANGVDRPEIGVILGTGLGSLFIQHIQQARSIDYNDIPHFPPSTIEFHKGKLLFGDIGGKKILAMQGRYHYYEGYSVQKITLPVRVMKAMGVKYLLISNAAGNMNLNWTQGRIDVN